MLWIQSLPAFQSKPEPRKTDGGHEETWPDQQKDNDKDKDKCKDKDNTMTFREYLQRVIFETFYQGDEKTRPDQQKDNDKDKCKDKDNDNDNYI